MLDQAVQPRGALSVAARGSAGPIISGIPPDGEANGRRIVTASTFRALQERLRSVSSQPAVALQAAPPALPEPTPEPLPAPLPPSFPEHVGALPVLPEPPAPVVEPAAGRDESGLAAEPAEAARFEEPWPAIAAEILSVAMAPADRAGEVPAEPPPLAFEENRPAEDDLLRPLVEKFSGTAALLKKIETKIDPFSETPADLASEAAAEEPINPLIDPLSGDVARSLLDVMSAPSGASQPQERSLAADTLLRLVPRLPLRSLLGLVERVSLMEHPPQLLVRRLIRDPRIEVAGPLLEGASAISDQDLMAVIAEGDASKQRLIARRRILSPALSTAIIEAGDAGALLTLVRNPGATFAIESFHELGELAAGMAALQAPLATRLDTPAPVAFELFWALPAELRRYVLSRFLTDSEILDRILKIALAVGSDEPAEAPSSDARFPDKAAVDSFVALAVGSEPDAAGQRLAELAGISQANADRIIADPDGEPITVALKALGLTRAHFAEVMEAFRQSPRPLIRDDRNIADLQSIFDSLSFNKARMLLTYWDWAAQHSGPYARTVK